MSIFLLHILFDFFFFLNFCISPPNTQNDNNITSIINGYYTIINIFVMYFNIPSIRLLALQIYVLLDNICLPILPIFPLTFFFFLFIAFKLYVEWQY
eukprot:UN00640